MGDFANAEALESWLLERGLTAKKASTTAATLFANGYDNPMSLLDVTMQELRDYTGLVGPIARELSNLLAKEDPQSAPSTMERGGRAPLSPTSSTQQPPDELTKVLKSMSISLHSIQETLPTVLSGHVVTPSTASRDRQRSASIFDAVGLALRPTEEPVEYALPDEQQGQKEWEFKWKWPNQTGQDNPLEKVSYEPVFDFLRGLGLLAEDVSEGRRCLSKLLYNAEIYSARKEDPNLVKGQKVYHRHQVEGRTDLVILTHSRQGGEILRGMVRLAIEIKTVNYLKQSVDGCMLEAQLQLIGLNAFNTSNSPPVVLTNLAKTHCVLYLAYKDDGWGYVIKKKKCHSFPAAVHFAMKKSDDDAIRQIFHAR